MARELFTFFFCAAIAFLLGNGYYKSIRSGVLTIKGRTYCRNEEPILYWISVVIGAVAFVLMVSVSAVMAFIVLVNLFGTSK